MQEPHPSLKHCVVYGFLTISQMFTLNMLKVMFKSFKSIFGIRQLIIDSLLKFRICIFFVLIKAFLKFCFL